MTSIQFTVCSAPVLAVVELKSNVNLVYESYLYEICPVDQIAGRINPQRPVTSFERDPSTGEIIILRPTKF